MSTIPTWDKITTAVASTTSEFGGNWANLISDYFNGVNIVLLDASKAPVIGTLTRFKPEKFGFYDPDESHYLVLSVDDIDTGPVRKVKFRRMNSPFEEDYAVLEGMGQTLLNKTIDADLNTLTNIENADVKAAAAIAYSKLNLTTSIVNADINGSAAIVTTKLADSTNFVLTTRANTFGDFDNTFKDNRIKINNPADTFAYTIIAAAIAANRNVTLPLLTGNDVFVTEAFAQALTNKTIVAGSNTITGIVDTNISAHTTTKITTTSKSLLNTAIVYNDQTNSFGDFNQVFKDNRLLINNPADTFAYTIIGAAIAAARNITLPLLTGDDVFVTAAFAQTLTNKTLTTPVISSIVNTGTLTLPTSTDTLVGKATTDVFTNKTFDADGTGNSITNIENADIKAAAGIVTTKLADSANFILKTLDNSFGAHYFDMTRMTAPANPAANDGRVYTKQIDANNDGIFCKIKKAGGFVEVQIV